MNMVLSIIIPVAAAFVLFILPSKLNRTKTYLFLGAVLFNFAVAIIGYAKGFVFSSPAVINYDMFFRVSPLGSFMSVVISAVALLSAVYAAASMKANKQTHLFYGSVLLTLSFVNGVLLADNFVIFLFFWEALMIPMFLMIMSGESKPFDVAVKAFIISAIADLFLMFGIMFLCIAGDSFSISKCIAVLKVDGACNSFTVISFIMLFIGAAAKIGAMPFHSWLPEASVKAPVSFMVFMVTGVEKVLGVYLLIRITNDFFMIEPSSLLSISAMTFGIISAVIANALAVTQNDFKKMLTYASIGQAGFMIVAISTMSVIGTIAALIHMHAHIIYKSSLFFVAGNIEKTEGTTDISVIKGGLRKSMPYTFLAFLLSGASFAGIPFFYAFYSKEMIYESALGISWLFYAGLLISTLFALITIIKWGSKLFFDNNGNNSKFEDKEVSTWMFIPTIVFSLACILFGLFHKVPLKIMCSVLNLKMPESHSVIFAAMLILISFAVLALAVINFIIAYRKKTDVSGYAQPVLNKLGVFKLNENAGLDPYNIFIGYIKKMSVFLFVLDKALNYFYDFVIPAAIGEMARNTRKVHNGNMSVYIIWILLGIICIFIIF